MFGMAGVLCILERRDSQFFDSVVVTGNLPPDDHSNPVAVGPLIIVCSVLLPTVVRVQRHDGEPKKKSAEIQEQNFHYRGRGCHDSRP